MKWFVNDENIYDHLVDEDPAHRDHDHDQDDRCHLSKMKLEVFTGLPIQG